MKRKGVRGKERGRGGIGPSVGVGEFSELYGSLPLIAHTKKTQTPLQHFISLQTLPQTPQQAAGRRRTNAVIANNKNKSLCLPQHPSPPPPCSFIFPFVPISPTLLFSLSPVIFYSPCSPPSTSSSSLLFPLPFHPSSSSSFVSLPFSLLSLHLYY